MRGDAVHVVIGGCGRVGSQLALELDGRGHDVVVVDKDPLSFRRLGDGFGGRKLQGIVFDRATLEDAGIKQASAYVAVTSGDNSNIVSARTARERFGVEHVVARIYDPDRAVIYERVGITTIASSRWTAETVLQALLPQPERISGTLGPGDGDVVLLSLEVPDHAHGHPASALHRPGHFVVAAVTRGGSTRVPVEGLLLEGGDRVHLAVQRPAVDLARGAVAALGEEGV